jgi:hypothetical protein
VPETLSRLRRKSRRSHLSTPRREHLGSRPPSLLAKSGYRPSAFDGRDFLFEVEAHPVPPPDSAHVLQHPYPPREQHDVPCCVSMAICAAMEILDARDPPSVPLSPLFHYYVARPDPRWLGLLDLRTALNTAATVGVCTQDLHAPDMTAEGARDAPSPAAYSDADRRRLVGYDPGRRRMQYERLNDVGTVRAALATDFPVIAGFWLTSAYASLTQQNPVHAPPPAESSTTGHGVLIMGFDDNMAGGAFLVKDSRGLDFANNGTWWLPYEVIESSLVHEVWTVRRITY